MGDTIAQTRSERVSYDSPLLGVNIPGSDEERIELKELMDMCTKLSDKVLDLENLKDAQALEIKKLKKREDASKHGRNEIDQDEGISWFQEDAETQGRYGHDTEINTASTSITTASINITTVEPVITASAPIATAGVSVSTVEPSTPPKTTTSFIDDEDLTIAQTLMKMRSVKSKENSKEKGVSSKTTTRLTRGVIMKEASKTATRPIVPSQQRPIVPPQKQLDLKDKGKGIMQEPEKPVKVKGKDQIEYDANMAKRLQAELDEEVRLEIEREEEASNAELIEEWDTIEARIDADAQLAKMLQAEEREQMSVEERTRWLMELIAARKKFFAAKRAEEQRNKPPSKAEQRKKLCNYMKHMAGYKDKNFMGKSFDTIKQIRKKAVSKKRAGERPCKESDKTQKIKDDAEKAELKAYLEIVPCDDSLAVPTFLPGDDPIACMNKAMAFMLAVFSSCYPSTNNQLRSSSNPRNQATVQGEIHQAKQRLSSSIIVKVKGTWLDSVLSQRDEGMLHDAYDSDCDDISSTNAALMTNLSSCDSDVLSEVPYSDNSHNDMMNQGVQELQYFEQSPIVDYPDNEKTSDSNIIPYSQYLEEMQHAIIVNESLTAELERYKERVKTLEQRFNFDLSSREKFIDSQMDDMIRMKNTKFAAFETEIDTLKQTLSKHVKEKESLLTTLNDFKMEFKEKESKSIDKEIVLENKNKELENIVCKLYQSMQIKPTLYDGNVLSKTHDVISVADDEETLILAEESRLKMIEKQNDPIMKKEKINITPINYSELNKLAEDFGKCFVPQKELSAEQKFWT
ncbi:hypothetical protein Tco_0938100 [Tanacetum coccineum]|uniref:Uncharacterized protein n=1 Tax=Tanacetum coccineum TaxID=301880 RepID=A0ABQ5DG67_9ASTR